MINKKSDDRSPIAMAMHWASQVTTISIEMILPIFLGVWVDQQLGSKFVVTLLGAAAGLWIGLWSLIRLGKTIEESDRPGDKSAGSMRGGEKDRKNDDGSDEIRKKE